MTAGAFLRPFAVLAILAALPQAAARAQDPALSDALNPLRAIPKSDLKGFAERPLFTPSRRAPQPPPALADAEPEPEPAAPPPPPAELPNLKLLGVLEGDGESVALVQDRATNATTQLRLGDMMDGWLVTAIEPVTLRLTIGDRDEEYRLFDPNRKPAPGQGEDGAPTEPN